MFTAHVKSVSASWKIVSAAGCSQDVTLQVISDRYLIVDTSRHTIISETLGRPYLHVIIDQWGVPSCETQTISTITDSLSATQFTRAGISSATLDVDQVILSDPSMGKYILNAHLRWTGVGLMGTTTERERFCDEGACFLVATVDQNRNATMTGTVTATVTPPAGSTYTDDYSPSAGTQVNAWLANTNGISIIQSPAP
jgi:hypothetical protein